MCKVGYFFKKILNFAKRFHTWCLSDPHQKPLRHTEHKTLVPFSDTGAETQELKLFAQVPRTPTGTGVCSSSLVYLAGMDRRTEGRLSTPLDQSSSAPSFLHRCERPWTILPLLPASIALPPSTQMLLPSQPPHSMVPCSTSKGPLQ